MRTHRRKLRGAGALLLALALVGMAGSVSAAPKHSGTHPVATVVARDVPGDALRSDGGLLPYANPPVTASIEDRTRGAGQYKIKDTFLLEVNRALDGRHLQVHVPGIIETNASGPVLCEIGQVQVISSSSPDWYNNTSVVY